MPFLSVSSFSSRLAPGLQVAVSRLCLAGTLLFGCSGAYCMGSTCLMRSPSSLGMREAFAVPGVS